MSPELKRLPLLDCERGSLGSLSPLVASVGPIALVGLVASGLSESRSCELLEIGVIAIGGPHDRDAFSLTTLLRPLAPVPSLVRQRTGLQQGELDAAPDPARVASEIEAALRGRTIVVHDANFARRLLARAIAPALSQALYLDTRDLISIAYPDSRDLEPSALTTPLLGRGARSRALDAAGDLLNVLAAIVENRGSSRFGAASRALRRFVPDSGWVGLFGGVDPIEDDDAAQQFVSIGASDEVPVGFDEDAIAEVLLDESRGRRHFPHYRARPEQVTLMRSFFRNLAGGGTLLLEGGTGVGKSLAYLAAAIPFAMTRARAGERDPVVISTRTKLLQDQLLEKDIGAAARMLGHPDLRALSIKGRANYVCEKRLGETLARGAQDELIHDDRLAFSVLQACARIRSGGEVGTLPAALTTRYPLLRDLVRGSVTRRAEQCSREECARHKRCPFGRRRAALGRAHLIVANHDLLLRWPPDYPRFGHVIADEGHELVGVADDVYAHSVRPEELMERIDDVFGAPPTLTGSEPGVALLPRRQRLEASRAVQETRRALALDLASIGRAVSARAGEYGEVELPEGADRLFPDAARTADVAAARLESLARLAEELDARAEWTFDEAPANASDGPTPVQKNATALREAAVCLRTAFGADASDVVAAFERLASPFDRWSLALRAVSPASSFHREFLESRESFAAVSASLFIDGDSFAALGELEVEERTPFGVDKVSLPSPFDYVSHMRVLAPPDPGGADQLVASTAEVIGSLARLLGGRTLGLFTSLRRMEEVAGRLCKMLERDGIEVLWPQRHADEPASLVRRFQTAPGGAVLLGARTFWQGVDIPGVDLQAVVIEKLPFEVPTELRRRREARIRELGVNAFERYRLGKMLLHLKQMTGRLIRGEDDRGVVVIVDARAGRSYFSKLSRAFPPGIEIRRIEIGELPGIVAEVGLGATLTPSDRES